MNPGRYTFLFACLVASIVFIANEWMRQPPPVRPAASAGDDFSAESAYLLLEELLEDRVPHPVGSTPNRRVRENIETFLTRHDIPFEVQRTWGCSNRLSRCARVENIIARIAGERDGPYVALMAHYDSVPMAPGAGDDGAGLVAVLESGRILKQEGVFRNPVLLIITDAEEMGLLGAEAFFSQHPLAGEVGVVLNIEGAGTTGVSQLLRTAGANAPLVAMYRRHTGFPAANSLTDEIFKRMPNDTDFSVSKRAEIPGMDFAFAGEFTHYHTPNDNLDNLDRRTLQHHGENLLPMARALASADLEQVTNASGNRVYFVALGTWVDWPLPMNWFLLAIAMLVMVGIAWRERLAINRPLQIALALLAPVFIVIATIAAGLAALKAVDLLVGTRVSWPAKLWPYRLVLFGAPLFGGLGAAMVLNRWLAAPAAIWGGWFFWWLLGVLLTLTMPGAAHVILAPLTAGVVLLLAATIVGSPTMKSVLLALSLVVATTQTLNIVLPLEQTQGYGMAPVAFPSIALFLVLLGPLARQTGTFAALAATLAMTLAGIIGAATSPLYSAWRPQHLNIQYVENVDAGDAWLFLESPNPPPERLVTLADFTRGAVAMYPFSDWTTDDVAKVPASGWTAPGLEVLADRVEGEIRRLRIELQLRRPARMMQLVLPEESKPRQFRIDGIALEPRRVQWRMYQGKYVLMLIGMNDRKVQVELDLESQAPFDAWLLDASTELPPVAAPLVEARPPLATPVHQGDGASLIRTIRL